MKNSEFIGLAAKVHSLEDINRAYVAVHQRFPSADHIMLGYAMRENGEIKSGFCDNKEYGSGSRIRKTIYEQKARNTAVFVVRKYGGLHLGYNRFAAIEQTAVKAITLLEASL